MPRLTLGVRLTGALVTGSPAALRAVQRGVQRVVGEDGRETQAELVATAPRDTGFLASRTRLDVAEDGLSAEAGYAEADFTAAGKRFYPAFLHEGTRYIAPRTWVRDAEANARARFPARVLAGVTAGVRGIR